MSSATYPISLQVISILLILAQTHYQSPAAFAQPGNTKTDTALSLGYAQLKAGAYKKAIVFLNNAVKQDSKSFMARRYLCYALLQNGEPQRASEQLITLSKLTKPTAFDVYLLGEVYLANGDSDKAEKTFRQSWGMDPTSTLAEAGVVRALAAGDKFSEAEAMCTRHIQDNETPSVRNYFESVYANIRKLEQPEPGEAPSSGSAPSDGNGPSNANPSANPAPEGTARPRMDARMAPKA
jgi:Flp pilus assembly protein TadD